MPGDERIRQLARLLGLPRDADAALVAAQAAARPGDLAAALVAEAAENDDVTSTAAAQEYLELRLRFFGAILPPSAQEEVRRRFAVLVAAWDRLGAQRLGDHDRS